MQFATPWFSTWQCAAPLGRNSMSRHWHLVTLLTCSNAREGAEFITNDLALRWAMESKLVERATWGRRLSQVRGFAKWLNAIHL